MSQSEEKTQVADAASKVGESPSPTYQTERPTEVAVKYVPMIDMGDSYILEISKQQMQGNGATKAISSPNKYSYPPSSSTDPDDIAAEQEFHRLLEESEAIGARIDRTQKRTAEMRKEARIDMASLRRLIEAL